VKPVVAQPPLLMVPPPLPPPPRQGEDRGRGTPPPPPPPPPPFPHQQPRASTAASTAAEKEAEEAAATQQKAQVRVGVGVGGCRDRVRGSRGCVTGEHLSIASRLPYMRLLLTRANAADSTCTRRGSVVNLECARARASSVCAGEARRAVARRTA
jgi:hypothetical protein